MKGVTAYIGQELLKVRAEDRAIGRADLGWRISHAICVLLGKCDVVIWEKWGDTPITPPEVDDEALELARDAYNAIVEAYGTEKMMDEELPESFAKLRKYISDRV